MDCTNIIQYLVFLPLSHNWHDFSTFYTRAPHVKSRSLNVITVSRDHPKNVLLRSIEGQSSARSVT